MRKLKWTSKGWTPTLTSVSIYNHPNKNIQIPNMYGVSLRSKVSTLADDEFSGSYATHPDAKMLAVAREEIKFGRAQDAIDNLPPGVQHLLRDGSLWYMGKDLFKAIDPETSAKDGSWGSDGEELYAASNLSQGISAATEHFIQNCIPQLADNGDILSDISKLSDFDLPPVFVDIDVSTIGISGDREFFDQEEIELEEGVEDYLSERRQALEFTPIFQEKTEKVIDLALKKFANSRGTEEDRLSAIREIDLAAKDELTNSLNSSQCGFQYRPPKQRWEKVWSINFEPSTEAADRKERFFAVFSKILKASNFNILFQPELLYSDGTIKQKGGYFSTLSKRYREDKELIAKWSEIDRVDKEGNITESALTTAKKTFIIEQRVLGKDEESIRRAAWYRFDSKYTKIPAVYDKNGNLTSESISWPDSLWRRQKREEMKELYLTVAQWIAVFKAKDLVKRKISLKKETKTEEERKIIAEINTNFLAIRTHSDLKAFEKWLYDRQIQEDYSFTPAPIDQITIKEEIALQRAISSCRKFLVERTSFFNKLDKEFANIKGKDSFFLETTVQCLSPGCDCQISGIPQFIEVKNGKFFLYIDCEKTDKCGCGRKRWLIPHKVLLDELVKTGTIKPKTIEEWMKLEFTNAD